MIEYTIKLSEESNLKASDGDFTDQAGLCLQIYQDLVKIDSEHQEDVLIKSILKQILDQKFGGEGNVPFPDYYKPDGQRVLESDLSEEERQKIIENNNEQI